MEFDPSHPRAPGVDACSRMAFSQRCSVWWSVKSVTFKMFSWSVIFAAAVLAVAALCEMGLPLGEPRPKPGKTDDELASESVEAAAASPTAARPIF